MAFLANQGRERAAAGFHDSEWSDTSFPGVAPAAGAAGAGGGARQGSAHDRAAGRPSPARPKARRKCSSATPSYT